MSKKGIVANKFTPLWVIMHVSIELVVAYIKAKYIPNPKWGKKYAIISRKLCELKELRMCTIPKILPDTTIYNTSCVINLLNAYRKATSSTTGEYTNVNSNSSRRGYSDMDF